MNKKLRWALAPGAAERGAKIPVRKSGDAGWNMPAIGFRRLGQKPEEPDLEELILRPGDSFFIVTGVLGVAPDGWHFSVQNRTGQAARRKFVAGAVVFDPGYRAEPDDPSGFVLCALYVGAELTTVKKGDSPVQVLLYPVWQGEEETVNPGSFDTTERGGARYGGRDDGVPDPITGRARK